MKLRAIAVTLAGFAVGFAVGFVVHLPAYRCILRPSSDDADVARHWFRVLDFNNYARDPKGYVSDPRFFLYGGKIPSDPEPSLAALVAAGELQYIDIVFPLVPYSTDAFDYVTQFVEERQDVNLFTVLNPQYTAYTPVGEQPLHVMLWFVESATPDVQRLFKELESRFGKQK